MIIKTLEIGWHEAKPIYSCDFQRRTIRTPAGTVAHKFATAGADTHIRVWLIHPSGAAVGGTGSGPKAEYLSTLTKHAGAVNVVRWSPNGELLASAADDGMLIIWTKDDKPQTSVWGRDPKETALDKESWRVLNAIRVTSGEVYDLAWSPTGEYILTGSTDNTARIFSVSDATCVREIADHAHYVQGVAWDPMNEYIATQSSDRSVKVYSLAHKHGGPMEAHPVGTNTRMNLRGSRGHSRNGSSAGVPPPAKGGMSGPTGSSGNGNGAGGGSHSRAPSLSRPSPRAGDGTNRGRGHVRRSSISSEASSVSMVPSYSGRERENSANTNTSATTNNNMDAPLTPATSVASGFGGMFLPPSSVASTSGQRDTSITPIKEHKEPRTAATSRRSSFSGSQAPGSPASFRGRTMDGDSRSSYGRSPSPMPPLPAIRTPHNSSNPSVSNALANAASPWLSQRLYADENATSFFRRLTFSPDGNLLYTPAGWFEDNTVISSSNGGGPKEDEPGPGTESSSCVYVYSKANFSKAPVAAYPGHRRAVVCVKFSSALYELRGSVSPSEGMHEPVTVLLEPGKEDAVDVFGTAGTSTVKAGAGSAGVGAAGAIGAAGGFMFPSVASRSELSLPSPALSAVDGTSGTPKKVPNETPPLPPTMTGTSAENGTASVFNLPYRMMFAVATQDTVAIHDTQQATPVCLLSKLHYDSFTDMAWSNDGHVLMLVSSDGYCTVVVFDETMPLYHTQQRDLQLKSMALAHSHPLINPHPHGHTVTASTGVNSGSHLQQPQPSASSSSGLGPQSPLVHPPPSPFVPPHAPSPALSIKDLPGPSVSGSFGPGTLKRSASAFDVPLTPAASISGGDGDAMMIGATGATGAGAGESESDRERERERAEEGPAKKRRRVELRHHGAA